MLIKQVEIVTRRCFHTEDHRVREAHSKGQFNGEKVTFLHLLGLLPKEVTQSTTAQVLFQNWVTVLNFLGIAALEHK